MEIWKKKFTLEEINESSKNTATENLEIVITKLTENSLEAQMPVNEKTCQPKGILHGGASALMIETLGSFAGYLAAPINDGIVGMEINANHIAGVKKGNYVRGVATPLHIGKTTHVWEVKIYENDTNKLCCAGRITLAVIKEQI
jgi:1,4-dihydroxy-2-naphthoyl-CoA hydrolase